MANITLKHDMPDISFYNANLRQNREISTSSDTDKSSVKVNSFIFCRVGECNNHQGPHDELVVRGGYYYNLIHSQLEMADGENS